MSKDINVKHTNAKMQNITRYKFKLQMSKVPNLKSKKYKVTNVKSYKKTQKWHVSKETNVKIINVTRANVKGNKNQNRQISHVTNLNDKCQKWQF